MGRSYVDASYRAKRDLNMGNKGSIDGTYQSAVDIVRHTFMQPVTVTDWNLSWLTGGTNFGADVTFYLGSSLAGTGAVTVIGTSSVVGTDGTQADASVSDESLTATTFNTGDDIVFQAMGTIGMASIVEPHVQYTEAFVNTDN